MTVLRNRLLVRIAAPASEPLTLSETKAYLRVDHQDEDVFISDCITSARMVAEHWLKRSLISQGWRLAYDDYMDEQVYLPMGPVIDIDQVNVIDRDDAMELIDESIYSLSAARDILRFSNTLIGYRIEIDYRAGYGSSAFVPKPIKQGLLHHVGMLYDHRKGEYDGIVPDTTARLYMPFRGLGL